MHIKPGLHSEQQRHNFLSAARLWAFGGPLQRRCGAVTKAGAPCAGVAMRGRDRCHVHARVRRAVAQPGEPLTAAEIAKRVRRQAVNRQRVEWRRDPWAPGCTIMLPAEAEQDFRAALAYAGEDADAMPPGVADWGRWKYQHLVLDRDRPADWAVALDQLRQRVRAAGAASPGWRHSPAVVAPELGYVMGGPASPYSRRRRVDGDRPVKPGGHAAGVGKSGWDAPLSAADMDRAVVALVEHRASLAPVLAGMPADDWDGRLRLARAFLALLAGGPHADWLDALGRVRQRRCP
jgi:hypothetical protein